MEPSTREIELSSGVVLFEMGAAEKPLVQEKRQTGRQATHGVVVMPHCTSFCRAVRLRRTSNGRDVVKRLLLWLVRLSIAAVALVVVLGLGARWYYRSAYPYGWSHCCLKGLGLALHNYAQKYNGHFPAGAGCPEASLSLLYREGYLDAETLRGKTVPVEEVRSILERGGLLGPDSCGWHYVEGLTTSDDNRLALVWDKVGLDHNGRDLKGGHSVWYMGGPEEVVPAADCPQFLALQQQLLAERAKRMVTAKQKVPQEPTPSKK
jgi:hypothetical protein